MALPVTPTIGGKGTNKLKTDMSGVSKTPSAPGKKVGTAVKTMKSKGSGARKRA